MYYGERSCITAEKETKMADPRYFFEEEGFRHRMGDDIDVSYFDGLISKGGAKKGDELYLIKYREGYSGCSDIGWMVIFDVDELFSKVFTDGKSSVTDVIGNDPRGTSIIGQFMKLLEENGIRYEDDWIRID